MMSGSKLLHGEVEKLAAPRHVVRKRGLCPKLPQTDLLDCCTGMMKGLVSHAYAVRDVFLEPFAGCDRRSTLSCLLETMVAIHVVSRMTYHGN